MTRERIAAMPEDDWRKRDRNFQEPLASAALNKLAAMPMPPTSS